MTNKILIVSEVSDDSGVLENRLLIAGFPVRRAQSGQAALRLIGRQLPALVVLDRVPDMSGLELCRQLKSDPLTKRIAVVLLSAEAEEIDRILGFELGADDFVVRPFSPRELVLRIKAILRQTSHHRSSDHLRVGDLVLDRLRREVKAANRLVRCTAIEFKLLGILMEREGRVQPRDQLLNDVWGYEAVIETRTVDSHMRRLRDKLGPHRRYIETIRGVGYRVRGEEV